MTEVYLRSQDAVRSAPHSYRATVGWTSLLYNLQYLVAALAVLCYALLL